MNLVFWIGNGGVVNVLAVADSQDDDPFRSIENGKNHSYISEAKAAESGEWTGERFVALRLITEFFGDCHGNAKGFRGTEPLEVLENGFFENDLHALRARMAASRSISGSEE